MLLHHLMLLCRILYKSVWPMPINQYISKSMSKSARLIMTWKVISVHWCQNNKWVKTMWRKGSILDDYLTMHPIDCSWLLLCLWIAKMYLLHCRGMLLNPGWLLGIRSLFGRLSDVQSSMNCVNCLLVGKDSSRLPRCLVKTCLLFP